MNNSSLACKGRAQMASKVRKKWSHFRTKNVDLPLYLRNAAPSTPIKGGSNGPAYEMRKKKANETRGKKEKKEEKWGIKSQKKKKKTSLSTYIFQL